MKTKRLIAVAAAVAAALFLAIVAAFAASVTLTVTPGNLQGWSTQTTPGAQPTPTSTPAVAFVSGPATPPSGAGSVRLSVGSDGGAVAQVSHGGYAGTVLPTPTPTPDPEIGPVTYPAAANELTALGYSTYVEQPGSGGQAPYIVLHVDYDNDGTGDDQLLFEPQYQAANFCPAKPNPAVTTGEWQTWDALGGCWYSLGGVGGSGKGAGVKPLREITAARPGAKIVNPPASGGVRVAAGGEAGAWDNFVGSVDAFRIGIGEDPDTGPNVTTYDFEPAAAPTPTPAPITDLGVTKTAASEVAVAGSDVTYTIRVTNNGPSAAANATLTDTLPGTMTFVSLSKPDDWSCTTPATGAGGTVTCTNASFPAGATATFTLVGNIPSNTPPETEFANTATVTTATPDHNDENNSATFTVTVVSCVGGPVFGGEPVVTNNSDDGPGSLRQVIREACPGVTITFDMNQVVSPIALTSGALLIDKGLTIQGPGAKLLAVTRAAAAAQFRIFNVAPGVAAVGISGLTISNGRAPDGPGNSAPAGLGVAGEGGGGILNSVGSTLTLTGVAVNGNRAGNGGNNAGITSAGGGGGQGGGIHNLGTTNIVDSTVSGNRAGNGGTGTAVGGAGGHGGGVYNEGTLTLTNSTVSGNLAGDGAGNSSGGYGGGIFNALSLTLTSSTVTGNRSGGGGVGGPGGGVYNNSGGTANVRNSIVAGNSVATGGSGPDLSGTFASQGYNLFQNTSGATVVETQNAGTNITGADPKLGPLADNGGNTRTHLLLPESPAIDKGNSFALAADQRGLPRPVDINDAYRADASGGDGADMGAVEVNYRLNATEGVQQNTFPGYDFPTQLQVELTESGRLVEGVVIVFTAPASGASVTFPYGNTPVTNAGGRVNLLVKANGIPGSYEVTANTLLPVGPPAVFRLRNLAPGVIQFGAASYQHGEGGAAVINVKRTGGADGPLSVNYSASPGTATGGAACSPGVDFITTSGTLSWADGDAADKTFAVTLCDDSSKEPDETIQLALSNLVGPASFGGQTTSTLNVTDDDDPRGGVIEFAVEVYGVAERGGQRSNVAVRRTGDTTRAASVEYTTDDGSAPSVAVPCSATTGAALQRCDYTHTSGTLHFAAGETFKSFAVPVNDDSYVEGSETTRLVLSNPGGGAALGAQSQAALQIDDDFTESAGNPIDDDRNFVRQHYHDFLSREPDATGWDFWANGIGACGADAGCREVKRLDTSAAFFLSIEFRQTGYFVYLTRKASFGNLPGAPVPVRVLPFLRDTQTIGRGVVVGQADWQQRLEANRQAFLLAFVQADDFRARHPDATSAAAFVNSLDANAGGVLSPAEKEQLTAELSPNPADPSLRASVLGKVASNEAFARIEFNRAFVLMQYFGYLRRDPDAAPDTNFSGYQFWLSKLEQFDGDYRRAEMVKAFLSSAEYRQRFGPQ